VSNYPPGFFHAIFWPKVSRRVPLPKQEQEPNPDAPQYGDPFWRMFWNAREEHAFLLRCEGCTFQQIGEHLGVSSERGRQMISKFARIINHKTRRMRVRVVVEEE
jgi:hypothetical protein